tara:strand:+ start:2125 stop:2862 length:738 start_codon:yes stop_codon:yes gene_type:complete
MSAFSNYFGGTEKGKKLFNLLPSMSEEERTAFLNNAEKSKPGITEEYNIKTSVENLGIESIIKNYSPDFSKDNLVELEFDIKDKLKAIQDIEKGTVDEDLATIEELSNVELMDPSKNYESVFDFLKDAKKEHEKKLKNIKKQGVNPKYLAREKQKFNTIYNKLWPKKAIQSRQTQIMQRTKSNIDPELQALFEISKDLEATESYYDKQFVNPQTNMPSEIAKGLYELSQIASQPLVSDTSKKKLQ